MAAGWEKGKKNRSDHAVCSWKFYAEVLTKFQEDRYSLSHHSPVWYKGPNLTTTLRTQVSLLLRPVAERMAQR